MIINANGLGIPLADGSVDAALCSPPYFGSLRVYDGEQATDWPVISYAPMLGLSPVEIPAQREALGHEPDPFAFVGHLLLVFREVRRVLRPGGVLAVNLGDSYAGSRCGPQGKNGRSDRWFTRDRSETSAPAGLPPKNLLLAPARFALAMQADGWILRSRMPGGVEGDGIEPDILWKKKSCMPSSVRDRPTNNYEDVFMFSGSRRYFWDQEAGREVGGKESITRPNMRSVWTINPEPTSEEHFAAWPVELAARLIRVMTSERGVCPECGAPWVRVVERRAGTAYQRANPDVFKGWQPSCSNGADPTPSTVLDPFAGLGRTWEAARETGRRFIGMDLGLGYCRLALSRNDLSAMERRRNAPRAKTVTGPLFGN